MVLEVHFRKYTTINTHRCYTVILDCLLALPPRSSNFSPYNGCHTTEYASRATSMINWSQDAIEKII